MVNSVINEGARGLQNSQRELLRNANEIVRAGNTGADDQVVPGDSQAISSIQPVQDPAQSQRSGDISEPLVELKRQELLFNASAKVVSTGDKALGSLLDTLA
jgi:hypothetical protein